MSRISNTPLIIQEVADLLVADSAAMAALRLGTELPLATQRGSGTTGSDNYASRVTIESTGLRTTEILIDIDSLASVATDNDVIGTGTDANAHIGQITAAQSGTIIGGTMLCLQAPTTGEPDLDLYSNTSGTIASDADGTGGTALFEIGGDWTAGLIHTLTGVPSADHYLYITVGKGGGDAATYGAGIFLITFYGV